MQCIHAEGPEALAFRGVLPYIVAVWLPIRRCCCMPDSQEIGINNVELLLLDALICERAVEHIAMQVGGSGSASLANTGLAPRDPPLG
jgi:hypothetical protein